MSVPNILDEKILDKDNNYLYNLLKYKTQIPKIAGTSSILSQSYPADIDMVCGIKIKPKLYYDVQKQFKKMVELISKYPNLFFIEFKIQNLDDSKYKIYNESDINTNFFKDYYDSDKINYCKIDLLQFSNSHFQEISCIYFFNPIIIDNSVYVESLLKDQVNYYNEKKYYKSLKRYMLACKYQNPPNLNVIIGITNFFNSNVGKVYQINNYVSACEIYVKKYGVDDRVKMFIKNLGLGNLHISDLKSLSDDYSKLYNGEALKFYQHFKIPVGSLMKFQERRL